MGLCYTGNQLSPATFGGQPIFERDQAPRPLPTGGAPTQPPLQRALRALAFAEERLNALRREFAMLWLAKDGVGLPGAVREPAGLFVGRMEALRARLLQGQRVVAGLKGKGPIETIAALKPLELDGLAAAVQGLEKQAQALRGALGLGRPQAPTRPLQPASGPATAPLKRPATAPLPASGARPGFSGLLKKLGEPAAVETLDSAPVVSADPALARARQAFEAAHALVASVLEYVTPRLEVVSVALDTTGLPGRKAPMEVVTRTLRTNAAAAGIPEPHLPWLPPFIALFYQDMGAVRKAHMAIVQWRDTRGLHSEAERLHAELETLSPPRQGARLRAFDLGRYRAAVYPVSHLHVSFHGHSPLCDFFPAP